MSRALRLRVPTVGWMGTSVLLLAEGFPCESWLLVCPCIHPLTTCRQIRYNEPSSSLASDAPVDPAEPNHPTPLTTLSPPQEDDPGSATTYTNDACNNSQNVQTFGIPSADAISNASDNIPPAPLRSELKALYSSMPFLKALSIRDRDFNHLNSQGCLRVPAKPILDEFVRHYFLYVHPMLPLLNEADFWRAYNPAQTETRSSSSGSPVSLLLLQSMMFASCTVSCLGSMDEPNHD